MKMYVEPEQPNCDKFKQPIRGPLDKYIWTGNYDVSLAKFECSVKEQDTLQTLNQSYGFRFLPAPIYPELM